MTPAHDSARDPAMAQREAGASAARSGARGQGLALAVKRGMDLLGAAVALAAALPLLVLAACWVKLHDGGPVFYRQRRSGRGGREFDVFKLRSMQVNDLPVHAVGEVSASHPLVTAPGRVIRRLKIDELPQLLSVLRGDMSLVGPRPTVPEQVREYGPFERRRLLVRPGLTGWAQVNGNVGFTWPERILLDVWYVDHWSLALDARILVRTAGVIVSGERRNAAALREAAAHARQSGTQV